MRWNHLPVAGGVYDQHPDFISKMQYIFGAQAKHDAAEQRKKEAEAKRKAPSSPRRGRRR